MPSTPTQTRNTHVTEARPQHIVPILAGGGTRLPAHVGGLSTVRTRMAAAHPVHKILPAADDLLLIRTFMSTISREYLSESLWLNTMLIKTDGMA
ncbi:MAG: hypothetical protein ACYCZA_08670 [Thiobacillus sp.]